MGMVHSSIIDSSLYSKSATEVKLSPYLAILTFIVSLLTISTIMIVSSLFINDFSRLNQNLINVIIGSLTSYTISSLMMHKLGCFPGSRPLAYLLPTVTISLLALTAGINVFRLEYSRLALFIAFFSVLFVTYLEFKFLQSKQKGRYAVLPFGFYQPLIDCNENRFSLLPTPGLGEEKYTGIILDNNAELPSHWQQFIAESLSNDIHVFNSITAYESITGKSPLDHYGEITYGELKPAPIYLMLKRSLETALVLLSSPLTIPLIFIVAIAVKLESKGPAFFTQKRVGKGGKEFSMYKLRSMCLESETNGAQFAGEDDPRITRIGKVIRKLRIDEIPQFLNILKGDMALIGPRPEQASFVREFEQVIPLYSYRHVVRPGISGWAQVTHGYAADEDGTREKLAHDFYYVKNLSLWLDLNIAFKTIKTMLTGFGAR
jgi:lipopolysaccharide/colanic/teichoic acid biosynthesis glycosyltransferase